VNAIESQFELFDYPSAGEFHHPIRPITYEVGISINFGIKIGSGIVVFLAINGLTQEQQAAGRYDDKRRWFHGNND
jgi:hypothetical protein